MDNNIIDKRTKGTFEVVHELNIQIKETGRPICSLGMNSSRPEEMEASKANAAFICKAVNNYDSLLLELKNAVITLGALNIYYKVNGIPTIEKAKEAIKKAEQ